MDKELKIIVGSTTGTTKIFVGDRQIGLIQDIKIHASVDNSLPEVEIVFPDLFSLQVDMDYNSSLIEGLKQSMDLLSEFPHVKVTLEKLVFDDA
jgi:hypothetical protein